MLMRKIVALSLIGVMLLQTAYAQEFPENLQSEEQKQVREVAGEEEDGEELLERVKERMASMTLDQKISQMIMPALRSWEGEPVTDLSAFPELAGALRRHGYGGVILFGSNLVDAAQTVRLVSDLQANNAGEETWGKSEPIPYLVSADQEGGSVARLSMGTRGTGSMAIGATGEQAEENARAIGRVFGEELSALGINVNLGPCLDVIVDLEDLGMSTRVFSDSPFICASLGLAFEQGVGESDVITTFKHFPGAGDGSDYPTSIHLTREQLDYTGLYVFGKAVENGAEMVMTSATTFPLLDDERTMADGVTKGYYPATLSRKIVKEILREEMGFDGVVITDALEMDQFVTEPDTGAALFEGERETILHDVAVAREAINVGCDILLLPIDLNGPQDITYYDEYIAGIEGMVEKGEISPERIDESVRRILLLKARHGILDMDVSGEDLEARISAAREVVGSAEHHAVEERTAAQAVTLLRNDGVLPLTGSEGEILILGRSSRDRTPITYALGRLLEEGVLAEGTRIVDRIAEEGPEGAGEEAQAEEKEEAGTVVVVDCYQGREDLEEISREIREADVVICLSATGAGLDQLQDTNPDVAAVSYALLTAREAGVPFVLLSDNLPVDVARFQEADAIVCAYLSAGFGIDPTARADGTGNVAAFNANVPAALFGIFGAAGFPGSFPITMMELGQGEDGSWGYTGRILYERGYRAGLEEEG